eukprot:8075512-Pyramimonas_sp.AAC.1
MSDAPTTAPGADEVSLRPSGMTANLAGGVPPGLSLRPGGGMSMGSFGLVAAPTRPKKVPTSLSAHCPRLGRMGS